MIVFVVWELSTALTTWGGQIGRDIDPPVVHIPHLILIREPNHPLFGQREHNCDKARNVYTDSRVLSIANNSVIYEKSRNCGHSNIDVLNSYHRDA